MVTISALVAMPVGCLLVVYDPNVHKWKTVMNSSPRLA